MCPYAGNGGLEGDGRGMPAVLMWTHSLSVLEGEAPAGLDVGQRRPEKLAALVPIPLIIHVREQRLQGVLCNVAHQISIIDETCSMMVVGNHRKHHQSVDHQQVLTAKGPRSEEQRTTYRALVCSPGRRPG